MSLQDWHRNGWLAQHATNRQEIQNLLALAKRDLADCHTASLSADWRLSIAHNAALQLAMMALAAAGFRTIGAAHHYRAIQSLAHTVGVAPEIVALLDAFRKKRNMAEYERAGRTSDQEAREMAELAGQLEQMILQWLETNHPQLL